MSKKVIAVSLCLIMTGLVSADDVPFQDDFSSMHIGRPEWTAVYSHMKPDLLSMSVQPVTGGPVPAAATFELREQAPDSVRGQSAYFRSGPINLTGKSFSVEWYENVVDGFAGPAFELWGKVGAQPNDRSQKCLEIDRGPAGLTIDKKDITEVKPGWRHFKINVDTTTHACQVFYENMDQPAGSADLDSIPAAWDHIGIGFCLYINPKTQPVKWQIGGVKISK